MSGGNKEKAYPVSTTYWPDEGLDKHSTSHKIDPALALVEGTYLYLCRRTPPELLLKPEYLLLVQNIRIESSISPDAPVFGVHYELSYDEGESPLLTIASFGIDACLRGKRMKTELDLGLMRSKGIPVQLIQALAYPLIGRVIDLCQQTTVPVIEQPREKGSASRNMATKICQSFAGLP